MLALCWLPSRILFIMFVTAAAMLGATGHVQGLQIPLLKTLVVNAIVLWLFFFIWEGVRYARYAWGVKDWCAQSASEGLRAVVFLLPSLALFAAPIYFMMTGALWPSIALATVAFAVSYFLPPPSVL